MSHLAHYNGKTVVVSFPDSKGRREFNLACMRIHDNGAPFGFVLTPDNLIFKITQGKRTAILLSGVEKEEALLTINAHLVTA